MSTFSKTRLSIAPETMVGADHRSIFGVAYGTDLDVTERLLVDARRLC
jgi:hypothetical protein